MRTIGISCRRCRRGVSTVLGAIIFVGILFSAVLPMYLVMRQADTVYDQTMFELKRLDEDRDREDIDVYAFPVNTTSTSLNVTVFNKCELVVSIVRVWINDTYIELNSTVDSMTEMELGSYEVSPQVNSSYYIKVTTDRGNVFPSETGTLYYGDEGWEAEMLAINVLISSSGFFFKIEVTRDGIGHVEGSPATVWKIGGTAFKAFDVTNPGAGTYNVKIYKSRWGGWTLIHEEDVTIEWPSGPPVIWVYA